MSVVPIKIGELEGVTNRYPPLFGICFWLAKEYNPMRYHPTKARRFQKARLFLRLCRLVIGRTAFQFYL